MKIKLTGKEGFVLTKQQFNDALQNAMNLLNAIPNMFRWQIFGADFLKALLDCSGAKGIKFELVFRDKKFQIVPIPVDEHGNQVECEMDFEAQDDPTPVCPPICS